MVLNENGFMNNLYPGKYSIKWLIFIAMSIMQIMLNFDLTAMSIVIAPMVRDLNASLSTTQWMMNGYMIASAVFIIAAGKYSEIFGKKLVFVIGVLLFIFSSLLIACATNQSIVIVGRVAQGVGAAIVSPLSIAMVFDVFPANQKNIAIGFLVGIMGLAQCVGPTLSGFLVQYFSWRWVFLVNIPLGIITVALILFFYKRCEIKIQDRLPDAISISALVLFLSMLIWGLNEISRQYYNMQSIAVITILALFGLLLFIIRERKLTNPLIDYSLFKNRNFIIACLVRSVFIAFGYMAILLPFGLYLQNILNYSPVISGLVVLSLTAAYGVLSSFSGFFVNRFGEKHIMSAGMLLAFFGFSFFAWLLHGPISLLGYGMVLCIIGGAFGLLLPVCSTIAMSSVPSEKVASAYSIFFTCHLSGMALNTAFVGILIQKLSSNIMRHALTNAGIVLNSKQLTLTNDLVTGTTSIMTTASVFPKELLAALSHIIQTSFSGSYLIVMFVAAAMSFVGFIIVNLFLNKKRKKYV